MLKYSGRSVMTGNWKMEVRDPQFMETKSKLKEQDVLLKGDEEPPLSEQGLGTENWQESPIDYV